MNSDAYEMDELFDLEYEDEMDVLREMESEAIQDEKRYLDSLKPSRIEPKSKKMLNFGTENQELTSHASAESDNRARTEPCNDNTKPSENSIQPARKRCLDEDVRVLKDCEAITQSSKKFKQQNLLGRCEEMDTKSLPRLKGIQSARSSSSVLPQPNSCQHTQNTETAASETANVRRRIPDGNFMAVTGCDGERVYLSVSSEDELKKKVAQFSMNQNSLQLLTTPLDVLKAQAEEDRRMKELQLSRTLHHETELTVEDEPEKELELENVNNHQRLWVDQYAPRKYTELLSDETINRGLLHWLKLWDYVVFGKETKTTVSISSTKSQKDKKNSVNAIKKPFIASEAIDERDQFKRPVFKLAMISGPPGLGKTTLAHIIAYHAGYNVVEINASDDRSPELFKVKIESATQMKAMIGADPRPNCLIIDEIDGAPQPAINVLLSAIKKTDHAGAKKKRVEGEVLRRPIICICNDLYVPALRQLRQSAFLVTFYGASSARLASRLLEISRLEKLKTDLTTLFALCEKAENDIRSCLNTLQFVKVQGSQLSLRDVQTMSLGQKDSHKTLFSVWNHVFSMPKPSRKRYVNPYDRDATSVQQVEELASALAESNTSLHARFHNMLQMALAAGEDNKIQQGLFENYLEAKVKDPKMTLVNKASDWFCFADVVSQTTNVSQNYSLVKYLPFLPVMFHFLFASNSPLKITYPHSQFEFQTKLSKSENLINTMVADVAPSVRSHLSKIIIVLELLPFLCDIIQPTLRPVNTQLYSAREKEELAQLIRVMIAYNLNYLQDRNPDGQYLYKLEPNVEELVRFPDIKPVRQLNYATRQLISREIELEKLRRSESVNLKSEKKTAANGEVEVKTDSLGNKQLIPNHQRQKLEPKALKPKETKPLLDFFGRKIQAPTQDLTKVDATSNVVCGDIWFRFKEGFSNAVRKTVRVQDLL